MGKLTTTVALVNTSAAVTDSEISVLWWHLPGNQAIFSLIHNPLQPASLIGIKMNLAVFDLNQQPLLVGM